MKRVIGMILFILLVSTTFGQVQKTLLKTYNLQGSHYVELDLMGEVTIKEWSTENAVRVQMEITYHNSTVHIMKHLISKGRYNLAATPIAAGLEISLPGVEEPAIVSKEGDLLKETIKYTVYLPKDVNAKAIHQKEEISADVAVNE